MNAGPVAPKGRTFGATGTLPQFSARASLASAHPSRRHTTEGDRMTITAREATFTLTRDEAVNALRPVQAAGDT